MAKILAVDDDLDILYTLVAIGDIAGWEMKTSASPKKAIEIFCRGEFDAMIVDYHMPEMDGVAFVREIRSRDLYIPIIVLTVDDRMILAERFLTAGASDFAVKPIKAADFISRINLHLSAFQAKMESSAVQPCSQRKWDFETLPKGLSSTTLWLIVNLLEEQKNQEQNWLTADEIAEKLGVSYQTVWRYLDMLEAEETIEVTFVYGGRGRPRKRYRLKA